MRDKDAAGALAKTAAAVYELIELTHAKDSRELLLIDAQESYVHPTHQFEVTKIA